MKLITPETIQFQASISEDEVRERMALEVLEQIGGLGPDGKPLPEITWSVHRGSGRKGGYVITIAGPSPARLALREKDTAMEVVMKRMSEAGGDYSDLLS